MRLTEGTVWTAQLRQLALIEIDEIIEKWELNNTLPRCCHRTSHPRPITPFLAFRYNANHTLRMSDAFYQMPDDEFQSLVDVFKSDHVRSLLDVWMIQRGFE